MYAAGGAPDDAYWEAALPPKHLPLEDLGEAEDLERKFFVFCI